MASSVVIIGKRLCPQEAGTRVGLAAYLRRPCDLWRGPLYYADHHGDFIILIDTHPGMSVIWGAEGA
jgi:hypothetical protein